MPRKSMFGFRSPCTRCSGFSDGIFAVVAALDLVAEHEGRAGGAVIGAGAVVAHATAELREHQHDHVVGCVVLRAGPS